MSALKKSRLKVNEYANIWVFFSFNITGRFFGLSVIFIIIINIIVVVGFVQRIFPCRGYFKKQTNSNEVQDKVKIEPANNTSINTRS